MNRRFVPALVATAALLAGCGGGGGSQPVAPSSVTAPTSNGSATTNRTAVATATLTIKFSPYFHHASAAQRAAAVKRRGAQMSARPKPAAASRKPAYVNSSNNDFLDVWVVNGSSAYEAVNSGCCGNVNFESDNGDGSQTLSVPLYSTGGTEIVAFESDEPDGDDGNLLAIGETDIASITPGSAPQINLTMAMNAAYLGIMSDPNDANDDATPGNTTWGSVPTQSSTTYGTYNTFCSPGQSDNLYFFAADADYDFVDNAGAGGVDFPTVSGWSSAVQNPANTLQQESGVDAPYYINFNNLSGGLNLNLIATNPAYPYAADAVNYIGAYPGIDFLYNNAFGGYDSDVYYWFDYYGIYYYGPTLSTNLLVTPTAGDC